MSYMLTTGAQARRGLLDMTMRNPAEWREPPKMPAGRHMGAAFFGDPDSGPFVALNSIDPSETPYKPSPGHGHRSDTWRIAIKGTLRMGAQRYAPGGFRFQEAGVLYGVDDVGWSPDGAYSVVMMADRRGTTSIPAAMKDKGYFKASAMGFDAWLGLPPRREYPVMPGVATTIGTPRFGRVDGSFAQTDRWRAIGGGRRMALGLCGDRESGPVVILIAAEAGRTALPAMQIDTEVLQILAGGTARAGDSTLGIADTRLAEAGSQAPALVAAEGAWAVAVIGDRRALASLDSDEATWAETLRETAAELEAALAA